MAVRYAGAVKTLGTAIRERRKALGWDQTALGDRTGAGQPTVSDWENDRTKPNPSQLLRLARVLGCTVEELLSDIDPDYDRWRKDHSTAPGMNSEAGAATRLSERAARDAAQDLSAAHDQLTRILQQLGPTFAKLSTLRDQLARRQDAMARMERPGVAPRRRSARQQPRRRRAPKPTHE